MDSGQQWGSASFRAPNDSGTSNEDNQRVFDAYLYEYLLKRNLHTSAQIFRQEAQIGDIRTSSLADSPGDFLFDWWAIFYDSFTARLNAAPGNQTALFSQVGQASSMNDLPPLPPFLRETDPMPLVSRIGSIPQAWPPTLDGSTLVPGTSGTSPARSVVVCGAGAILPPVQSHPNGSVQASSTGATPPVWWALEQAPDLNFQSPGSSNAVVLTPWNVNSVRPVQIQQPRPSRRGGRRGGSSDDPIDVEAPRGRRRPRSQLQALSTGSSSRMGANARPAAALMPPPPLGSLGMSPARMQDQNQMVGFSRLWPFSAHGTTYASASSSRVNSNGAGGYSVPSSLGLISQAISYGPLLSTYQGMLSSSSNWNSDAQNAANLGMAVSPSSSTSNQFSQGQAVMTPVQSSTPIIAGDGANTQALGQPSTAPAVVSHGTHEPSNSRTEKNEEVSSALENTNMEEADKNGEEHREEEDDTDVGEYLNYTSPVAPPPQSEPSQLIQVRGEGGLEFKQEACLESNLSELWCCHFSSTGKYLACAGAGRKVIVWNMASCECQVSEEHHDEAIIDIRFKPNSPIFASASFDKTIRIWDATKPEKALAHLTGHAAKVTSLDFHPAQIGILCSCDAAREIRFWNLTNSTCLFATKGASQQVRFQTQKGKYIAAVSDNTINILDSETGNVIHCLKGHIRPVECVSWDSSGRYLASSSQESAHIWSVSNWCTTAHKLTAEPGQNFKSCIFHPGISHVVILASDKNIEIWNPMQSARTLVVPAHESYVAGLTSSISTDIIASASHDGRVKLWK